MLTFYRVERYYVVTVVSVEIETDIFRNTLLSISLVIAAVLFK